MKANKKTLVANTETAFEFDRFYSKSVIVKNMTGGSIQFCDGAFDATKAATIPAYGWQLFDVVMPYGETPKFHVKAAMAGDVEIDFGSNGMGFASNTFDLAGMIPHTLAFAAGDDTTLTITLTRLHGETLDLDAPVTMTSGATVFNGDVISITPAASAGYYAKLIINGINYGRLEAAISLVIDGETTIETESIALVAKTATLTVGTGTALTAVQTRLAGMVSDLSSPDAVTSGGTVHIGDTLEFTAATTEGAGYHVTLTVNDKSVSVDKDGKASIIVDADIVAVSASVADGEG